MKKKFYAIAALFLVTAFVVGQTMGFAPIDMSTTLELNVEWVKGYTGHTDGVRLIAEAAGAGVAKEALEKAVTEVKAELEKATEGIRTELKTNLETQIKELDARIDAGEKAGEGVAELKEESAQRSTANAEFVEKMEKMVKTHADSLNKKLDELAGLKAKTNPLNVNYGEGLAKAATEKGMDPGTNDMKAIFKFEGMMPHARKDISVSGATVYEPQYVPGIIGPGERGLRVRDLLPRNRTSQNQVFFVSETSLTDNAGPQALGATKGETTFIVTVDSETVQTIAHFIQVPTQLLDDIPALEDYTNGRMMFLLDQEEEDQLLYGDDTGQNLNGLMTQATSFDTTLLTEFGVSDVTDIDRLRAAIAQVNVAEYPASGIVMHTYNWAAIELLKESTKGYIFALPQDRAVARMWGLPVVPTSAMASPDFLVGAFSLGAAIWDKQASQISISTEDADNFQKNMATIRAEERITLTVYRTLAFVEGNFSATIT